MSFRKLTAEDANVFYEMCEEFFHSSAVLHPVPSKHHIATLQEILRSDQYLLGYLLEADDQPAGFAVLNKMMQQEAGGLVIWVECLYVRPQFRSHGLGRQFLQFIAAEWKGKAKQLRLEVEPENKRAASLYQKMGYQVLPYQQMILPLEEQEKH